MSFKSTPKGFLLSSTPVQSQVEDSGYFGSSHRKKFSVCNSNIFSSYSPIRELCFQNLSDGFPPEQEFDENFSEPKFESKILDYENFIRNAYESSSVGLSEFSELESMNNSVKIGNKINQSCEQNFIDVLSFSENKKDASSSLEKENDTRCKLFESPPSDLVQENLKSLKGELSNSMHDKQLNKPVFKKTKVDFIHQLKKRNCFSLLTSILSYLSPKELCTASFVNKEWNQVILNDNKANLRRKDFLKERDLFLNGPSKENRLGMKSGPQREHKTAFSDLTNINIYENAQILKDSNTRFDSFIKESKNGYLKLLKCTKCNYASKCLKGNVYKCTHCSYTFCSSCFDPVFKNHTCSSKSQLPNTIIGSKKSKKNLRRL